MAMSFQFSKIQLVLFLALTFSYQVCLGEVICENLPKNQCAFAISKDGKRCLIENYVAKDGKTEYQCRTSEVVVEGITDWIETDECVNACGADRNAVGISSDSLMESQFVSKLCSPYCYQNCPNFVDLYFNLAAGENVFLPQLCEDQRTNPRRAMIQLMSSGAAPGPVSGNTDEEENAEGIAPAPAPMN
ncbi:hypothetical protein MKW92_027358 [Papaver armeniacum]|nr:hypothetical protein MKW92_027358 [Papaver armeniacum]